MYMYVCVCFKERNRDLSEYIRGEEKGKQSDPKPRKKDL